MPVYQYKCKTCDVKFEKLHGVHDEVEFSCECGETLVRTVDSIQVNYKGWDWVGKNRRENQYRNRRSEILAKRQKDTHAPVTLVPNVGGEILDSWEDAKKLASEKGYVSDTYDTKINGE